jgi:hypothetical protein
MTAPIGTDLDRRCKSCGFDPEVQGHRSIAGDAVTGCTDSGPLGLYLARQRRDEGMAATVEAHPDDAALVDRVLAERIRRGGEFSLNDLRPALASVKAKNVIGARVQAAARAKRIVRVGYVPSTDPATHGHPIANWRAA